MTTEAFLVLYGDTSIHDHVQAEARRHTRNVEFQKDLCQEAWLRIAQEPTGQRSVEWYSEECTRAIHTAWKRDYRRRKGEKVVIDFHKKYYSDRYE